MRLAISSARRSASSQPARARSRSVAVPRQRQLPSAVEHALFQIAQEGLWNAVRHAHATQAWLSLAYAEDQVLLSVADDGSGDPAVLGRYLAAATSSPGTSGPGTPGQGSSRRGRHGLRNIAERAAELGGEVSLRRRRGGGVRISVRVPVEGAGGQPAGTVS